MSKDGARCASRVASARGSVIRHYGEKQRDNPSNSFGEDEMGFLLLQPDDLEASVSMAEAIDLIEVAYSESSLFPIISAPRRRIHSPAGVRMSIFPGGIHSSGVIGLASHAEVVKQAGNVQRFENREHQICLLHDSRNAQLIAILIGAVTERSVGYTTQTALRTGATSGVGFRHLARSDAKTAALLGAGDQAAMQVLALRRVRDIKQVKVYTPTRESRTRFAQRYGQKFEVEIVPVEAPEHAVEDADVVICATNSNVPVLKGEWLQPGQHVTSIVGSNIALVKVGWLKKARREIDDEVVKRANLIAVNSRDAIVQDQQGDLFEPVEAGLIVLNDICEIGEIASGVRKGRTDDRQITLHKNNAGMGVADLALATHAYVSLKAKGAGRMIELSPIKAN